MTAIVWDIDNTESIAGLTTNVLGSPKTIETPNGKAVEFDGAKDGLVVDNLPLAGAEKFTLEIVFRPDPNGLQAQRFLHLQQTDAEYRILIETRLTNDNRWYLDTYINSAAGDHTLAESTNTHPTGQWYSAALIYDGKMMRHFVNGRQESAAPLEFAPLNHGKTSIGVRLNQVFWFKGAIRKIRFTPCALETAQLLQP